MKVLSFDTGETTGWCYQSETDDFPGGILDMGQIEGLAKLTSFLHSFTRPVDQVVIEKYIVWGSKRGKQANIGSTLPTVRAIGIIESWCYLRGIPYHLEYTSDLCGLQAKVTGMSTSGPHSQTHWIYAANHGRYWLIQNGYAKGAADLEPDKPKKEAEPIDMRKLFGNG